MLASDGVWYHDVHALTRRPREFWPGADQSPAERLNSVVRLAAYITLALSVYRRDSRYFMAALVFIAVASVAFHRRRKRFAWQHHGTQGSEHAYKASAKAASAKAEAFAPASPHVSPLSHAPFPSHMPPPHPMAGTPVPSFSRPDHHACTLSTPDNPFANMLVSDLATNPGRPPACKYDVHKHLIRENFNRGLVRNAYDVYEKENSQRQFMTMPVTTSVPDTLAFARFCYGNAGRPTCKEDPSRCTGNFP